MEPKEGQKDLHIITFVYCLFILYVSVTEIVESEFLTSIEYYMLTQIGLVDLGYETHFQ